LGGHLIPGTVAGRFFFCYSQGMSSKETAFRIHETAIQLFKEKGYSRVTIDHICKAASVPRSTFFYHFKKKNELLNDFFRYKRELSPQSLNVLVTSDSNWEKVWTLLEPLVDWTLESGPIILSQVMSSQLQDQIGPPERDNGDSVILNALRKGQENGEFRNTTVPELLRNIITHTMAGIHFGWCCQAGKFDLKKEMKNCIAAILDLAETPEI
jgi:AcrR family transcriptional regulator